MPRAGGGCCTCKAGVSGRSENVGNGLEPGLCSPMSGCCSRRPGCVSVLPVTCMEVRGCVRDRPLHCSAHGASWEKHLRSVPQSGRDCAVGPGQSPERQSSCRRLCPASATLAHGQAGSQRQARVQGHSVAAFPKIFSTPGFHQDGSTH